MSFTSALVRRPSGALIFSQRGTGGSLRRSLSLTPSAQPRLISHAAAAAPLRADVLVQAEDDKLAVVGVHEAEGPGLRACGDVCHVGRDERVELVPVVEV